MARGSLATDEIGSLLQGAACHIGLVIDASCCGCHWPVSPGCASIERGVNWLCNGNHVDSLDCDR